MGIKEDKKTNTWMAFYSKRHPVTRQPYGLRRKNLPTKVAARKVEKALVILVEEKIRKSIIPTWSAHLESFFTYMENEDYSKKTIQSYRSCLKAHTLESWGDKLIEQITPDEIRELIRLRVGNRSTSHQANLFKFIKAAMVYGLELGHINQIPMPNMKFKKNHKIKKVLTRDQVKLFLETAKEMDADWYPHWCMAIYTGLRNGELYALTWDKVCFEKKQILVNGSWNNVDGFKDTKSGDDRIVAIAPKLLSLLKELKLNSYDSPFVLPRLRKWDKGEQARELRLFLMGLRIPTVRFHDLRATWATIMLSNGVPPIKVMAMGGWKDFKTMQIYARKAGVDIEGSTDKLDLHDPFQPKGVVLSLSNKP